MLLSGFTNHFKELLLGVNIGGMGTLIASLASVISYKIYTSEFKDNNDRYLSKFTLYNVLGLGVFRTNDIFTTILSKYNLKYST